MIKLDKVKADLNALKVKKDGHVSDWLKEPWNSHHYVDMFVESCRAAPYTVGHVLAVYVPLSILLILFT